MSAKSIRRHAASALLIASTTAWLANGAHAQQVNGQGPDFDPVTRALSDKNPPPPDPNAKPAVPALTPEQQAELDRQKHLAEIQQKREESKKKLQAARDAQKAKEVASKAADKKRADALKAAREERSEEVRKNHEDLKALLQEQKDARKAYEQSKSGATGSTSTISDDYRKAEKDREKKIQQLRHPKYKPIKIPSDTSTAPAAATPPATGSAGSSTALGGTTTSGNGPNATTH